MSSRPGVWQTHVPLMQSWLETQVSELLLVMPLPLFPLLPLLPLPSVPLAESPALSSPPSSSSSHAARGMNKARLSIQVERF